MSTVGWSTWSIWWLIHLLAYSVDCLPPCPADPAPDTTPPTVDLFPLKYHHASGEVLHELKYHGE